jgi:hypothetical protein
MSVKPNSLLSHFRFEDHSMRGFSRRDHEVLEHIKASVQKLFTTGNDPGHPATLIDLPQCPRTPMPVQSVRHAYVLLHHIREAGFQARLVLAHDEIHAGQCLCEIDSADHSEQLYLDNRHFYPAHRNRLLGYYFYFVSTWTGEPTCANDWLEVNEHAEAV